MAEGILFGIAEEVLKNLGSKELTEIALAWGFKDRLEKLKRTINTIKNVLLDAEDKQADNRTIRDWLEKLATEVYAADDLFDKVATVASQKQLRGGNKAVKEVQTFFSRSNQIVFAFSISRKIKSIREKLDDIVKDNAEFGQFVPQHHHLEGLTLNKVKGRDQTFSDVDSNEIIGREDDKKVILDLLVASIETENEAVQVIPIVGMGGQGKTALAQLIYNDPQVMNHFNLRLWVCVSEDFFVKEITEKILKSATNAEPPKLELDQLRGLLRNEIGGKRYLLILDDVWNQDREEWLKLMAPLNIGGKGSKILVTTRSREVANIVGTVDPHDLQGLKEEKSWELFQRVAFKPGQHQENSHLMMMKVGKEIVDKCANLPLAIRVVGSFLYGQDVTKWTSLKMNKSLANISSSQKNSTLDILKLSYHHLPSPLKNCFAYCALYPKDYEFNKETLIDLWMAEGFVIPDNDHEGYNNQEDLAEDYFRILLQRCFFQDIKKNEWGDIEACKMHDLMHDLAVQVAGVKCHVVANSDHVYSNKGTHHLSFAYDGLTSSWKIPTGMLHLKHLRTFLLLGQIGGELSSISKSICQELISSFRCLRVLDLSKLNLQSLPNSVGKLIHLRYLNLSHTYIRELPDSITNLQNLQTLKLNWCSKLRLLPENMRNFYSLRRLDVAYCVELIHMPLGLGELTSLCKLPIFIVKHKNYAKLDELRTLDDLRGPLCIKIEEELENPLLEAREANLKSKHGITKLDITIMASLVDENFSTNSAHHDENVLEGLKPHPNLKVLNIGFFRGRKLPSWVMNNLCTNLPNLVKVSLDKCRWLQQVPSFRQLPSLKILFMWGLTCVKYMDTMSSGDELSLLSYSSLSSLLFFPSLEELHMNYMDNLEGWWNWKGGENGSHHLLSMSFPKLSTLSITSCPKLKILPPCPNVGNLRLVKVNKSISVPKMVASMSASGSGSEVKKLTISNVEELKSLSSECLHQLVDVRVQDDENLVSTDEVFLSLPSSLRSLELLGCKSLRCLGHGLEHLTALEKLVLWGCERLEISSSNEQMPWKSFTSLRALKIIDAQLVRLPSGLQHSINLRYLDLSHNYELVELPKWISCFRSLGVLTLFNCPKLTSLPDGFHKLTSLSELQILDCPELTERCRPPNGTDWPNIQHIPNVKLR